eukprot:6185382-Pleurochrysis_carterae.AAC.5
MARPGRGLRSFPDNFQLSLQQGLYTFWEVACPLLLQIIPGYLGVSPPILAHLGVCTPIEAFVQLDDTTQRWKCGSQRQIEMKAATISEKLNYNNTATGSSA